MTDFGFQRAETDFFSGEPLRALSTLVYSDNVDLQRSASLTFAEITERGELARHDFRLQIWHADYFPCQTFERWTATRLSRFFHSFRVPISKFKGLPVLLWETLPSTVRGDTHVEAWYADIAKAENKVAIVSLGGLSPLIRQMMSPNVEVQCNAVGCITNLATHEENKAKIARSGALGPLTRLAKSKDMRVQRNATGALLNMTHSGTLTSE